MLQDQDKIKILEYAIDYHFGSLWWGAETFIKERFAGWGNSKRYGHPLLSLRDSSVKALYDIVPMLVGTTRKEGQKAILPIEVTKDCKTDFGTHIASELIFADDYLYHSDNRDVEKNPETALDKRRRLWPNFSKPRITDKEDKSLRNFIEERKYTALQNGGYEK